MGVIHTDGSEILEAVAEAKMGRRALLGGAAGVATLLGSGSAFAAPKEKVGAVVANLAASPPPGFVPFAAPGRVVRVEKKGSLQANQLYPKPEDAKAMLEKALMELTGESDLVKAVDMGADMVAHRAVQLGSVAEGVDREAAAIVLAQQPGHQVDRGMVMEVGREVADADTAVRGRRG